MVDCLVIDASLVDGLPVLQLVGDLDAASSALVRETAAPLLMEERRALVLDMSGVERVYTAGILVLADLQKAMALQGGRLVCCGARPFIRELLRITMVDRTLDLHPDLETVLELNAQAS